MELRAVPDTVLFICWADVGTVKWAKEIQKEVFRVEEPLYLFWQSEFEVTGISRYTKYAFTCVTEI